MTISKLRKRNKISSSLVYVLHETQNCEVVVLLIKPIVFFDVLVAVRVVGSQSPYSLDVAVVVTF